MSLGVAVLELATDGKKLEAGLKAAEGSTRSWAEGVSGVAKGAAVAIAGVGTAALGILGGLTAAANKVAENAGQVNRLKRELGLTAQEASKLSYASQRLGLDTDEASKAFGVFGRHTQELSLIHI